MHYPGTGRIRLADVQVWQPINGSRVDLTEVETVILDLHKRFGLSAVAVDPFQAELLCQRLQRAGLPIYTLTQTGINLQAQATAVLDGFREKVVDLYPHDALLADLAGLQIAERNYGFRLVSPRATRMDTHSTAHGDCGDRIQYRDARGQACCVASSSRDSRPARLLAGGRRMRTNGNWPGVAECTPRQSAAEVVAPLIGALIHRVVVE